MESIGANNTKTHLPQLLDRVARGESLTITRHGKPVAHLVPVTTDRERARKAAERIIERRRHLRGTPLAELITTIHEGSRYSDPSSSKIPYFTLGAWATKRIPWRLTQSGMLPKKVALRHAFGGTNCATPP